MTKNQKQIYKTEKQNKKPTQTQKSKTNRDICSDVIG